jgi:hypothetical protein
MSTSNHTEAQMIGTLKQLDATRGGATDYLTRCFFAASVTSTGIFA